MEGFWIIILVGDWNFSLKIGVSLAECREIEIEIETLKCSFPLSVYYQKYLSKEKYLFVDQPLLIKIYSRHSAKLTPIFREKFQSPTHMMIQKPSILTVPCSHPRLLPALDFAPPHILQFFCLCRFDYLYCTWFNFCHHD